MRIYRQQNTFKQLVRAIELFVALGVGRGFHCKRVLWPIHYAWLERRPSGTCRPIYAGAAVACVRAGGPGVRMLTIRSSAFLPAPTESRGAGAPVESVSEAELAAARQCSASEWLSEDVAAPERPELAQARVVVAGGRLVPPPVGSAY